MPLNDDTAQRAETAQAALNSGAVVQQAPASLNDYAAQRAEMSAFLLQNWQTATK